MSLFHFEFMLPGQSVLTLQGTADPRKVTLDENCNARLTPEEAGLLRMRGYDISEVVLERKS